MAKKKLRKMGDILLDMEPLLDELVDVHEIQRGDLLALIFHQVTMHNPSCVEEFADGTSPVWFYGHQDHAPKKEIKYPQ
jgi:hypothetical protein